MIVSRQVFTLPTFKTASGRTLKEVRIGFETYGTLNDARDNAILICHYFGGTAHAAGKYQGSDPLPGWWDSVIGPGKVFDTDRYFVVCSDVLCCVPVFNGHVVTTGPATVNPETGQRYGLDFPVIRYVDLVRVQRALLLSLGIDKLIAVAGPSAGAFQSLQWSVEFPEAVPRVIAVVSPGIGMDASTLAVSDMWTRPIRNDPDWRNGQYDPEHPPLSGIAEALRIAAVSAMTEPTVRLTLGDLAPADPDKSPADSILNDFLSASLLRQVGVAQARIMDANHYLYLVRAGQLFDVEGQLAAAKAKYLFLPVRTDTIATVPMNEDAVAKVRAAGLRAEMKVIETAGGHLDGLTQVATVNETISAFLNSD